MILFSQATFNLRARRETDFMKMIEVPFYWITEAGAVKEVGVPGLLRRIETFCTDAEF